MSRYYDDERDEQRQWEAEHEHRVIWKCPQCGYSYESERDVNEALLCPDCHCLTIEAGESYRA